MEYKWPPLDILSVRPTIGRQVNQRQLAPT
jgi:hypothetical protein